MIVLELDHKLTQYYISSTPPPWIQNPIEACASYIETLKTFTVNAKQGSNCRQKKPPKMNNSKYIAKFYWLSTLPIVSFIPFLVFGFWSLLATKLRKYYVIFVYILQGKMGKTEKNRKENHKTKVTKIPKTKRRKYGMNETTFVGQIPRYQVPHVLTHL